MRVRGLWLVLGLWGCTKAQADGAPPAPVGFDLVAAGDTAKLYLSWTAAAGALGAQLTVTVFGTNGVWAALPVASPVTAGGSAVVVTNSPTADSATFVACLRSTKGTLVSVGQTCNQRAWKRALLPPPVVTFDSLVGLLGPYPNSLALLVGESRQMCLYYLFGSGHVAQRTVDGAVCGTDYAARYAASQRATTVSEQVRVDGGCQQWTSSNPAVATVTSEVGCVGLPGSSALGPYWMGVPLEQLVTR